MFGEKKKLVTELQETKKQLQETKKQLNETKKQLNETIDNRDDALEQLEKLKKDYNSLKERFDNYHDSFIRADEVAGNAFEELEKKAQVTSKPINTIYDLEEGDLVYAKPLSFINRAPPVASFKVEKLSNKQSPLNVKARLRLDDFIVWSMLPSGDDYEDVDNLKSALLERLNKSSVGWFDKNDFQHYLFYKVCVDYTGHETLNEIHDKLIEV